MQPRVKDWIMALFPISAHFMHYWKLILLCVHSISLRSAVMTFKRGTHGSRVSPWVEAMSINSEIFNRYGNTDATALPSRQWVRSELMIKWWGAVWHTMTPWGAESDEVITRGSEEGWLLPGVVNSTRSTSSQLHPAADHHEWGLCS